MSKPRSKENRFREILRTVIEYHDTVGDDFGELAEKLAKRFGLQLEFVEEVLDWCYEMNGFFEECVAENILEELEGR